MILMKWQYIRISLNKHNAIVLGQSIDNRVIGCFCASKQQKTSPAKNELKTCCFLKSQVVGE